jgi:methionine biosynthesis protein MetW
MALRPDLSKIAELVPEGARVLDVGCGEGELMDVLRHDKHVDVRGMEIDAELVEKAVSRGLSVVQGDADRDLSDYPDASYDVAILSQTLQTASRPDYMLDELLRIGRTAFVSFPNFAYWKMRVSLLVHGRMPVTPHLPVSWYETKNIHHLTVDDFRTLLADKGVTVEGCWFFANGKEIGGTNANWRAEHAVFRLSR